MFALMCKHVYMYVYLFYSYTDNISVFFVCVGALNIATTVHILAIPTFLAMLAINHWLLHLCELLVSDISYTVRTCLFLRVLSSLVEFA